MRGRSGGVCGERERAREGGRSNMHRMDYMSTNQPASQPAAAPEVDGAYSPSLSAFVGVHGK